MSQSCAPYPPELRQQIVELVRQGYSIAQLSREYGPAEKTIRSWLGRTRPVAGAHSVALDADERGELLRLRRENDLLREERDLLERAAALFARRIAP